MLPKDPTSWLYDPNVHIPDDELLAQAEELEPTLTLTHSRIGMALWLMLVSAVAGTFGGLTFSDLIRSSWLSFALYLVSGAALLRYLKPISTRVLGPAIAWQSVLAFFWSFLLAAIAVWSGHTAAGWWAHTISIGGGLFIGLMYGSLNPGFIRQEEIWGLTALPMGAFSTWSAAGLQRAFDAASAPAWSEAYVGLMVSSVFMVPMGVLMAYLSSPAQGMAKLATLYLHNDNFLPKAIEYLDRAIALSPRNADFHNLRGIAYSRLGDAAKADADFHKVSELMPRAAEAHMNRGVDFLKHGDFDRAIASLNEAAKINPKLATIHSNLGTVYLKKGDLDAAVTSYDRAIKLRAKYPTAFSNRAYAYFLKGDHDRAIADAQHAIKLDSELAMGHINLGHALEGKGEPILAARSFRQGLDLNPDPEGAEEALKALERLRAAGHVDDEDTEDEDE